MNCERCKSSRVFVFTADKAARAKPEDLPVVCRDCGLIMIGGVATSFPPDFEAQAKSMAEAAAAAGEEAVAELADPNQPVKTYFQRVYRTAYLDGFWRALLFARHEAKEGRVRRLRELWKSFYVTEHEDRDEVSSIETGGTVLKRRYVFINVDPTAYDEFHQLLQLGAGEPDVARPSIESPPVPSRDA